MCGIAGWVGASDAGVLAAMTDAMHHRGPDAGAVLGDGPDGVQLGHRRLAVLDLAGGAQPMLSHDGALAIVFNGEIYNFAELRRELQALGARFFSDHSDTEVILEGWRAWGEALLPRLNGMWAFALHDRRKRELWLSRDRFGKKPLYYHDGPAVLAFASELSALKEHPAVPRELDPLALRKYFAYGYIPAPNALLRGVRKLQAGHSLCRDLASGQTRLHRHWRYEPAPDPALAARPVGELAAELRAKLSAAVARRLVADVPVGLFLSGGIDSSLVAALAVEQGHRGLECFSIGFDDAAFDETAHAERVAKHLGLRQQVHPCRETDLSGAMAAILARLDEPMADASLLPTYLLCQHARRHVTVALGGDGADELFAGYDPFKALAPARLWQSLVPRPLHDGLRALFARLPARHGYMTLEFKIQRFLAGLSVPAKARLPAWMAPLQAAEIAELLGPPADLETLYSEAIEAWERADGADDIERATCFFVDLYLQDDILTKVDRASMMNSLEVRSPFLDIEVVDFARRLPSHLKLRRGTSKWLLRTMARDLLPEETLARRKQGFAVPVGRWFKDGVLPGPLGMPAGDSFARRLARHRAGRSDDRLYLWSHTVLERHTHGSN
jgi:asparagine synthase (glutamine-hydrolysing)